MRSRTVPLTEKLFHEGRIVRDPRGGTLFVVGGANMTPEELAVETQRLSDECATTRRTRRRTHTSSQVTA